VHGLQDGESVAESSALAVDASEVDLSAAGADNTSLATSGRDDAWLAGSQVDNSSACRLQVPATAGAVAAAERGRASDMDDSTEDDLGTSHRPSVRCVDCEWLINSNDFVCLA